MKRTRIALAVSLALCASSAAIAAADPALVKARQKFFGIENVDVNTGAVKKDKVIVDIGYKSEGIIPAEEFDPQELATLTPGTKLPVYIEEREDSEGNLMCVDQGESSS